MDLVNLLCSSVIVWWQLLIFCQAGLAPACGMDPKGPSEHSGYGLTFLEAIL